MSKFKYTDTEQQINNVLKYQDKELKDISFSDSTEVEKQIKQSEDLLRMLGKELPSKNPPSVISSGKGVMVVPSWSHLVADAEKEVGTNNTLEELFTPDELRAGKTYVRQLNGEYNQIHRLDKIDITLSVGAGLLAATIDILMVGIPEKTPEGLKGGPFENYVRDWFDKRFPEEEMEKLANSKVSKVPFDAQDNRNTAIYVEGLSAYYHRMLSLGHDPVLGFLFGVVDILTGRMTTIDKTGKIVSQLMPNYADRTEADIFHALAKQVIHFKSDITTSMGLPAPFMALFNLLQFGSIGEEEQTVAEIVQGMYYEGYDFIHFCSLSIPVMIEEVVTRIGYAIKSIKSGRSVKESIPFSTDRATHPKLGTMLFISHAVSSAINAGKVYFTKNPMAINYPQWIAFAKYSYQQVKWVLVKKPAERDKYVRQIIEGRLDDVFASVDERFDDISKDYIVVIEG